MLHSAVGLRGPYPIFCRGHSGGRLVCEAFIRNGIDMGETENPRRDTSSFAVNRNTAVREAVRDAFRSLGNETVAAQVRKLMRRCVLDFHSREIEHDHPFGWKLGVTIFTMPAVLDAFPSAKGVHLIRDGRDVMLSRLNARVKYLDDALNRLTVFGDAARTTWRGEPLSAAVISKYRNELEMLHWVTAVGYGLRGRLHADRYLEIRYEEICRDPITVFGQVFDFLEVPFLETTKCWLRESVRTDRIGKWKALQRCDLEGPLEIGGPMLRELGYL